MRFHLREALRARLPFSALSLSLSLALSLQLIQVHLSVQFFVVAFRGRRKGAARRTRRKSCCRFRLWYFESWPLPRPRDWDPSSWIDCCSEQSGAGTERKHTHTHTAPRALSGRFWLYSTNLLEKSLAGLEKKTGIIQSGTEETLREADEGNTKELRTRVYVYVTAILFGNQEGSNLAATYWLNFEARAGGVEKAKGFQYLT